MCLDACDTPPAFPLSTISHTHTHTHTHTHHPPPAGIKLWESGDLQRHNVAVMGTPISTIVATEDREIFSEKLREIDETLALSYPGG